MVLERTLEAKKAAACELEIGEEMPMEFFLGKPMAGELEKPMADGLVMPMVEEML